MIVDFFWSDADKDVSERQRHLAKIETNVLPREGEELYLYGCETPFIIWKVGWHINKKETRVCVNCLSEEGYEQTKNYGDHDDK